MDDQTSRVATLARPLTRINVGLTAVVGVAFLAAIVLGGSAGRVAFGVSVVWLVVVPVCAVVALAGVRRGGWALARPINGAVLTLWALALVLLCSFSPPG